MKGVISIILATLLSLSVVGVSAKANTDVDVPKITKEGLKSMLGGPDVIILDVRVEKHWTASGEKIPGAVYEDYAAVTSWAQKYPKDKTIVTYCA